MPRGRGSLIAHHWQPIADLPSDWQSLCRPDLHAIHERLDDGTHARSILPDPGRVTLVQERLMTVWAVETGIIEGLYSVGRDATIALAEVGLDAMDQFRADGRLTSEARLLIEDQRAALEMVMDLVGGRRELSSSYIRELHRGLTEHQDTRDAVDAHGTPIRRAAAQGRVEAAAEQPDPPRLAASTSTARPSSCRTRSIVVIAWYAQHDTEGVCPEVEAAWLHHRFAQIHPFEDGNGRVARALTAAVFLRSEYLVLVIRDEEHREPYLNALEAADDGHLKPLVDLFADIQAAELGDALTLVRQ